MTGRRKRPRRARPNARDLPTPHEFDLEAHPDVILEPARLRAAAARSLGCAPAALDEVRVLRKAIDARRGKVRLRLRISASLDGPLPAPPTWAPEPLPAGAGAPVIVIGAGPAGMFCALGLARAGVRTIVMERGKKVRARRRDLAALTQRGALDPESNYCFGEGGAGTFSDGKLYTRSKKRGEIRDVLESLVRYGAPEEILIDARPHIGTNRLPKVITNMRQHLEAAGVEFRFDTRVDDICLTRGRVDGVRLRDGRTLQAGAVILAPGHSSTDIIHAAVRAGATVEAKSFAMGVRIEHRQSYIDGLQYGPLAGHPALGAANYRLVEQVLDTGVFSFCMCPGGVMVPASTQPGQQVVNGWSPARRRGQFANSGFVTEIGPTQLRAAGFDPDDLHAGLDFQRSLERRAFTAGGGDFVAPAQTLRDLVDGTCGHSLPPSSYHRGIVAVDLQSVLGPLTAPIREALRILEGKMPGFVSHDAVAVGVESRTSSPIRLRRDPTRLESIGLPGLFPCGEGAGYAGGIISAALDGLNVARAVTRDADGTPGSPTPTGPAARAPTG